MTQTTGVATVSLIAPLTGVLVPIEQVPDPVFAQKMVGEGVSIDPLTNVLVAPCAGEVTLVHASKHAVTVRHDSGLEVLLHIGLDTVAMNGEGFTPKVQMGSKVAVGDPLIEFDLDVVATTAKSVLTQMVISNSDRLASFAPSPAGLVTAGSSVVAEATLNAAEEEAAAAGGGHAVSEAVIIQNPTGLHARPTATLANLAKQYQSQIRIARGDQQANVKSLIAVLAMGIAKGDKVQVLADGPDAATAVKELAQAIREGLGEEVEAQPEGGADAVAVAAPAAAAVAEEPMRRKSDDPNELIGVAASPGLAVGTVVQIRRHEIKVEENASDKHQEVRKLNAAIDRSILDLSALESHLRQEADPDKALIFAAHQELLSDPDLLDLAKSGIDKGKSAAFAWRNAYESYAAQLAGLTNEVLAGRASDVRDVGVRVLEELTGEKSEKPDLPEGSILVAEDLTPSDTATLDRTKVVGFATTLGGASSHVAIIARSLDIAAVAGIEARALDIPEGSRVILDGSKGTVRINVSEEEIAAIHKRQEKLAARREKELAAAFDAATTSDGHHVEVVANIGDLDDAKEAMTKGAEGVGLLRSEFVFLGRGAAPTEDEQAQVYSDISRALKPGQRLVIRTLDVGGDKPLPYLPIPVEENPFLGIRGVRVAFDRPGVLRAQCRAILKAADAGAKLNVMFPMIATFEDWEYAKKIWDEERATIESETEVPVGIMMEVPSVAVMAKQFAASDVAFFSVGTNDLTSYTLAMDRGHPKLATQVDPCNPAVLTLIGNAADALHEHGKWIGICGGVASDAQAVPILVGLGVDELSCSIPAIPAVKAAVRAYSLDQCKELAAKAVACSTPAQVRALVPQDES